VTDEDCDVDRSGIAPALGQGESPSGPTTTVVMPCATCVSAAGLFANSEEE
jgi:hypothetical protein